MRDLVVMAAETAVAEARSRYAAAAERAKHPPHGQVTVRRAALQAAMKELLIAQHKLSRARREARVR